MWGVAAVARRQGWEEPRQALLSVLPHPVLRGSQGAWPLSPALRSSVYSMLSNAPFLTGMRGDWAPQSVA